MASPIRSGVCFRVRVLLATKRHKIHKRNNGITRKSITYIIATQHPSTKRLMELVASDSSRPAQILDVSSTDWGTSQNRLLPQVTLSCACCEAAVSPRRRDHFRVQRTSSCIRLDCATRRITTDLANQIDATPVCRTDARKTDDVSHAVVTTEAR